MAYEGPEEAEVFIPAVAVDGVEADLASAIDHLYAGNVDEAKLSLHYVRSQIQAWSASRLELEPDCW